MADTVKDFPPYLDYPKPKKKQTNADRIRQMTDEEMAKWANDYNFTCPPVECKDHQCEECWLYWLKQEVSE